MKNRIKALFCIALCAAMMMPAMVSCADRQEDDTKKPAVSGTNREDTPDTYDFPEEDFDEAEFKFLHYGSNAVDYTDEYIWSENFTGGAIGDAVIERNQLVEDKYNVVVTAEECGGPIGEATKRMQAGQCDFDVIYEWGIRTKNAALDSMFYDALDFTDVDMSRSYWVPSANESLTVGGHLFIFTNMVTMNSLSWADMVYFNKNLMDKLNFDYPYDHVDAGTWTYDLVIEMCTEAEEDVNGDGEMGVEDQFGGFAGHGILGALCSAPLTQDNGDGTYTVITYTEGMVAAYNQYAKKLASIEHLDYEDVWEAGVDISQFESKHKGARFYLFGEDHQLFMGGSIDMSAEFTNMQSDYGVVPSPVNKAGDEYSCGVDANCPIFSMPVQLEDPEMAAIVFDYMAYESERLLLPAYFETTIKTKRMEDVRDYEMLDIVRSTVKYDWTGVYMWDSELAGMRNAMLTSGNFKSVAARLGPKCQKELDDIVAKLEEIIT